MPKTSEIAGTPFCVSTMLGCNAGWVSNTSNTI